MKILLKSIYPYAFSLLLLIVPFDDYVRALPNILLAILGLGFFFTVTKQDFKKLKTPSILLFFALIVFIAFGMLINGRMESDFFVLKKILIVVVLIILSLPIEDMKKVFRAIIFSSLLAIVFSLYNIVMLVAETGAFDFGNNTYANNTLLFDRLYLGLLSTVSFIISYASISSKYKAENRYHLANVILQILFVLLVVSRFAIIAMAMVVFLHQFYLKMSKGRIAILIVFVAGVLVAAFAFNKNMSRRFLYAKEYNADKTLLHKVKTWEPRVFIWSCVQHIADSSPIGFFGKGFEHTQSLLDECYSETITNESQREWYLKKGYNTHNQYLDFYLSAGLLAAVLFVLLLLVSLLRYRKSFFPTALLLVLFLFCGIENIFHRQLGAYFFGIILIFSLFQNPIKPQTE
ncbi:O-antigen ligase family protein [Flavobacteriaceae bacterium TK19130]|nr:O-antigen ligase family protein [Thermobacterium salinum]